MGKEKEGLLYSYVCTIRFLKALLFLNFKNMNLSGPFSRKVIYSNVCLLL